VSGSCGFPLFTLSGREVGFPLSHHAFQRYSSLLPQSNRTRCGPVSWWTRRELNPRLEKRPSEISRQNLSC